MATVELTVQETLRTGLQATYSAATGGADGNVFNNATHDVVLHVKNGGGGACAVTIVTPNTIDGLAIADQAASVAAGEEEFIGPFPPMYDQVDSDNSIDEAVQVKYDQVTSVTVAAIRVRKQMSV